MCFYCEQEFEGRKKLQQHQNICAKSKQRIRRRPSLRRLRLSQPPGYKCRDVHPDNHKRHEIRSFVESLGLVPKSKLATIQKRRTREVKVDEIEVDERPIPKTPTTPRSNKSLISQLSRDLSPPPSATKLLSPKPRVEELGTLLDEDQKDDPNADADSVCSNKSDTLESEFNPRRLTSLLAIDLCSPLGQRVKKHVDKLDNSERSPYEEYCHTPVKNKALDRLRNRPNMFPVTFRKSKRLCPKQCHWYKFTRKDRREFLRICATGLNKRARLLKKQMQPCKVVLTYMKEKDIEYWTTPKKRTAILQIQSHHARMYQQQLPYHIHPTNQHLRDALQNSHYYAPRQRGLHEFMRLGNPAQMPFKHVNSGPHQGQQHLQQRPCKAVLSNRGPNDRQQGMSDLSVFHLPLTNPPVNRNFGKPLQPGGFYGPKSRRPVVMNSKGHRPNILSKENGSAWRNNMRPVRRLSMENSPSKGNAELTAEYLRQLPSSGPRRRPDDDVISISSTESDSEQVPPLAPAKRPLAEDSSSNSPPKKRQRTSSGAASSNTQIILFRCHLCQAEITCSLGQTDFIQKHFSDQHSVNNIHLLEHVDSNNQKVVTIVEDNGPVRAPHGPSATKNGPKSLNNGVDVNRRNNRPYPAHSSQGGVRRGVGRGSETGAPPVSNRILDNTKSRTSAMDISGPPEVIVLD